MAYFCGCYIKNVYFTILYNINNTTIIPKKPPIAYAIPRSTRIIKHPINVEPPDVEESSELFELSRLSDPSTLSKVFISDTFSEIV